MTQAEGRARRRGQVKHVHIYQFVSLNTIDVDVVEDREHAAFTDDALVQPNYQTPYPAFKPSGFGLVNDDTGEQGMYRSETSIGIASEE